MSTTSRLGLDYVLTSDTVSNFPTVDAQSKGVLDNAVIVTEGTLAGRPAAAAVEKDRLYKATDTGQWFISDQTNWLSVHIAGVWQSLSLGTGVSAVSGYTPSARVEGDIVRLKGRVTNSSGGNITDGSTVFTVPASCQPTSSVSIVAGVNHSGGPIGITITITTGGVASFTTAAGLIGSGDVLNLNALTYTLS